MTEGLFVLTTLFVAYVIYVIVNEKKAGSAASKSAAATQPQPVQQAAVTVVEEKPKAAPVKAKPAAKKVPAKPAAVGKPAEAPVAAPEPEPAAIKSTGLKDPKTSEVATTYSNYRFTKRWIKEALVAENLVEKVYKNDELNADVEAKIKAGIAKLEGMEKYKA
ncbi:MAG: hypothetical protein ABL884_11500 [Methyloglobulus sp.]